MDDPRRPRELQVARWASHLAVWGALWVPVVSELVRGWRPIGDDATISFRSWEVFTSHSPLVGMFSTTTYGSGHILYDPGPLQFWLLAVPVRIDPAHGALWGAALLCALALSVGVEALRRAGHSFGALAAAVLVADVAWLVPEIFLDPTWNPNMSFLLLGSALMVAWVVAEGRLRWWPVLVLLLSVTVQAEFFYVLLGAVVLLVATAAGLARRTERGTGWLVGGLAVGAGCWVPALVQQATAAQGNLGLLLRAHRTAPLGAGFGLRALAYAASPRPIWLTRYADLLLHTGSLHAESAAAGVAVAVAVAGVAAWAIVRRRPVLASLAVGELAVAAATVVTLAIVPGHLYLNTVRYLLYVLWVLGAGLWCLAAWVVAAAVRALVVRARRPVPPAVAPAVVWSSAALAVLAGGLAAWSVASVPTDPAAVSANNLTIPSRRLLDLDGQITRAVERQVPKGGVRLSWCEPLSDCPASEFQLVAVDYFAGVSVAWHLTADGWEPALPRWFTKLSGISYAAPSSWPVVRVVVHGAGATVTRLR